MQRDDLIFCLARRVAIVVCYHRVIEALLDDATATPSGGGGAVTRLAITTHHGALKASH